MSKMNICKNEENWTCGNNEVVVDNPLNKGFCNKFILNQAFRDNCRLQQEQPDSFLIYLTLVLGSLANIVLRMIEQAFLNITHLLLRNYET